MTTPLTQTTGRRKRAVARVRCARGGAQLVELKPGGAATAVGEHNKARRFARECEATKRGRVVVWVCGSHARQQ